MNRLAKYLLTLSILYIIIFSSCSNSKGEIQEKDIFRYNQIGGLESLDPAFAKNLAIMWTVHFLYNTLVEVDSQLNIQYSLAKSHEVANDGKQYIFHLRNDVFFHDHPVFPNGKGRKMIAQDLVYSFNRIINDKTASPGAWVFNDRIAEENPFEAKNDSTFIINLSAPFGPFLEILSMPYCSVVPREVVERYGEDFRSHPCGTGPFQFVTWDEGNTLILHKNPNYFERDEAGNALPYLKAVQVSFNETRAMEFLLLQQKKLDFVNGIDGTMKDIILTKNGELKEDLKTSIKLTKRPYLNTEYIGILTDKSKFPNTQHPLLDKEIRTAINSAIDRKKIVTYFRNGVGIPAFKGFTPSQMPGMENRDDKWQYDPAKSAKIFDDYKKKNKDIPPIILATPEANADVCNFIASQLKDVGLETKVQVYQPGLLRQMMSQSQMQFFKAQWIADYPDAETYLAFFYGPMPAPPNYTRFNNDLFNSLYRQAITIENVSERQNLYRKMDSLISDESPVIPLFYDEMLHFTRNEISGFAANPMNIIDIKRVKKQ